MNAKARLTTASCHASSPAQLSLGWPDERLARQLVRRFGLIQAVPLFGGVETSASLDPNFALEGWSGGSFG